MDAPMITKDSGEIVDAAYLRRRVGSALALWHDRFSRDTRRKVLDETVGNPEWMRARNGYTVGAICRAAVDHLLMENADERAR